MKTLTKTPAKHWDQTLFWRIVWHLGWFIQPLKTMYINKIRNDPDFSRPRAPMPPAHTEEEDHFGV